MSKIVNKKRKLEDISNKNENNKENKKDQVKKSKQPSQSKGGSKKESNEHKRQSSSEKKIPLQESSELSQAMEQMNIQDQHIVSQVVYGDLFSLYGLSEMQPMKIKEMIDEIFTNNDTSKEFILKTLFLYFFELMGFADKELLEYCCSHTAKNANEKNLNKLFEDKVEVSFDKLIFFSQEKKSLAHKKLFKKIIKIYFSNIIDSLPQKEEYLTSIIERVLGLSRSQQRLVRYSFTYYGLYIYKNLLSQYNELYSVYEQLQSQVKQETRLKVDNQKSKKQLEIIKKSLIIIQQGIESFFKNLLQKRLQDTQDIIRKSVLDFLQQLDINEMQTAYSISKKEFFDIIFNTLRDSDLDIKKIGLQLIHICLSKAKEESFKATFQTYLDRSKLQLLKIAIPSNEPNKSLDPSSTVKCLQIIQKMYDQDNSIYNKDQLQMIINLIHYPSNHVKEEVVNFLLSFIDDNELMEIQKINPAKMKDDEEIKINFNEEPNKSQKQIMNLLNLFDKYVQTRSQFIKELKKNVDGDVNMFHEDQEGKLFQTTANLNENEERAIIMISSLCKKTSVIFDIQSLCDLLKKEDQDHQTQQVLVHLLYQSLNYLTQVKNQPSKDYQQTFQQYYDLAVSFLKFSTLNELLQTFRTDDNILNPLLKTLLLCLPQLEKEITENSESIGKDLTHLLLKLILNKEITQENPLNESLIKHSIENIVTLKTFYPQISQELSNIILDFNENFQNQAFPKLFTIENTINIQALSYIAKFGIILNEVKLKDILDQDFLKNLCTFIITNYTVKLLDHTSLLTNLTRKQFNVLIQLPLILLDQLLIEINTNDTTLLKFQLSMIQDYLDFLIDLHQKMTSNEHLQVSILAFLITTLNLTNGDENLRRQVVMFNFNDNEKVSQFITTIIQNTAQRIKCNDQIVQEQFQILTSLFMRDTQAMLSMLGLEYLIHFATQKDTHILKEVRKLLYSYKIRDGVNENKKSVFYQLIFKALASLYQLTEDKILKLLDQTRTEIAKEMVNDKLDDGYLTIESYCKVKISQMFVKNVLNSITLIVIAHKLTTMTKQQEEQAYFKLVEDVCKLSFKDKSTMPMLTAVKSLMHKNFIQESYQDMIIKGISNIIGQIKEKMNLNEQEIKFVQDCIENIKTKKIIKSKKINVEEQNQVDQQDEQEEQQINTKERKSAGLQKDMIGKKRTNSQTKNQDENLKKQQSQARKQKKTN